MKSVRSLLQNAATYSFANILNAAVPFLLLPILTRMLVPADYGILAMFNAALGILGAFTGLSVHGAVNVRFVDRENIDFSQYVGSCLCVLLLSTLATLGVVALLLKPLSEFTAVPPLWLLLAVIVSGCNFLIQIRLGIWMMAKKPVVYGGFQLSLSFLNIGLSLFFVILLQLSYEGRLLGQLIAVVLFAVISLMSLSTSGWVKFRPRWQYIREALDFGLPMVPHVIGGFLIAVADRFIIKQKIGLEAAGIYMVAVQLGLGMGLLADAFNKAFIPWLYEHLKIDSLEIKRNIVKGTWVYFCVALMISGMIASLSYWIILVVAGPEYIGASGALAWIAFGQAFGGMYLMVTNYIFYKRKTKILAWVTLVSGVIGVLLTWFLIPIFGIAGAGLSFSIGMSIRFFLTWFLAQKVCPMPWFSFCR